MAKKWYSDYFIIYKKDMNKWQGPALGARSKYVFLTSLQKKDNHDIHYIKALQDM